MKHAKMILRKILCLPGDAFGLAEGYIFGPSQTSSLKTFADGTNYSFRRQISGALVMTETYLSVTFNAVIKPVLTVAVVLTPANPGAATVTV